MTSGVIRLCHRRTVGNVRARATSAHAADRANARTVTRASLPLRVGSLTGAHLVVHSPEVRLDLILSPPIRVLNSHSSMASGPFRTSLRALLI
jgi:hypothetical protein